MIFEKFPPEVDLLTMEPCAELGAEWSGLLRFDRTHPPLIAMQAGALLVAFSETAIKPRRVMVPSKCQEKTHRQSGLSNTWSKKQRQFSPSLGPVRIRYTETGDQYIGDCRSASDSRDFGRK